MSKQQNLDEIIKNFNNFWINGQKKDAEIVIKRALRIYPKMHQLWSYRGIACASLEKFEEAKKSFLKAIELSPNSPRTTQTWATYCFLINDTKQPSNSLRSR